MRTRRRALQAGLLAAVLAAAVGLFAAASSPAQADLTNPRQDWWRDSTAGLFLHWGERTSPAQTSCSGWQSRVNDTSQTGGRWEASKWVNAAKQLHVSYIVLAAFHSRLGYARAWPSQIPGTCSTTRDYLGELITAAHAAGLKVINYMTDDPSHHDENGFEYFNSAAYSKFKGRTIDLSTENGFGEFSYDNFFEVMRTHPDLDGFWIDNNNDFWLSHDLYHQIHALHDNMVLTNNNEDTGEMDAVSHEQKTGMTPPYDMPKAIWTSDPRLTEADFKLPSAGAWWYDGSTTNTASVDRKLSIGRFLTNAGSSIKSLMAETAKQNGDFPDPQVSFNSFFNGYANKIWESIGGCEGGGYLFGGLKPGSFGNGAYGVTTVSRSNPNLNYIHVIDPSSTDAISVRDNGYQVTRVTDLRTMAERPFTQSNGTLRISGIPSFDPFDTVFKVETNGRVGIYPTGSFTATASAQTSAHPAAGLADQIHTTYWDSNTTIPVSVTLDLGSAKKVAYLGINQTEWSVSYNKSSTETSARIQNYSVAISTTGSSFTTVKTATLPNARGVQFIDLNVASARFVRLTVTSTYAASTDSKHFHKLRVNELWPASDYAGAGTTPPPGHFEAENATISSGSTIDSNHLGFSGTGFVNTPNATGAFVEWSGVNATAGTRTLTFRFSNGSTAARPADLVVNGGAPVTVNFPTTANWDTWATVTANVPLNATGNTIRLTATTAGGLANMDWMEVS
jgi:alpha-L-fucosidase